MRVLLGYALIGDVREHVLPIATGPGGNGEGLGCSTRSPRIIGDVDTGGYGLHANEGSAVDHQQPPDRTGPTVAAPGR